VALTRVTVASNYLRYQGIVYNKGDIVDFVDDPDTLGKWIAAGWVTQGFTQRSFDDEKYDCALVPTSIASTNLTGKYFNMTNSSWAEFHLIFGPLVTTGTVQIEVLQAKDVVGTSAATLAKTTTITNATEITHVAAIKTITLATFAAGATITITAYRKNSATATPLYPKTYTAQAGATDVTNRLFQVVAVDATDAGELVKCLNDSSQGTPEIFWTSAAGVVTGQAVDDSTTFTITCSVDDATDVRAEPQGQLIVRIDNNALSSGYNWVAAKVTTTATVVCAVSLTRHGSAFSPNIQQTDLEPVSIIS
jgi:hypothetical protein